MTDAERTAWFRSLKVGDGVAVRCRGNPWNDEHWVKSVVDKVTPKGRLRLRNFPSLYKESADLSPWTPEIEAAESRRILVRWLAGTMDELSRHQAARLRVAPLPDLLALRDALRPFTDRKDAK